MDTAKGAALMAVNEGSIWEYSIEYKGQPLVARAALPKIAISSTAGTGCEVNSIAVIGNAGTHQKGPVRSIHNFPTYAPIDPEFTLSMPSHVTASTGFDAFTHAFERYMQPSIIPSSTQWLRASWPRCWSVCLRSWPLLGASDSGPGCPGQPPRPQCASMLV